MDAVKKPKLKDFVIPVLLIKRAKIPLILASPFHSQPGRFPGMRMFHQTMHRRKGKLGQESRFPRGGSQKSRAGYPTHSLAAAFR
jgi:hypothetical protein